MLQVSQMTESEAAEEIRAVMQNSSLSDFALNAEEKNTPGLYGSSWFTPDKSIFLSTSRPSHIVFRDFDCDVDRGSMFIKGSIRFNGQAIKFCVLRWLEKVSGSNQEAEKLPQDGLRLNFSLEQLNYRCDGDPVVDSLNEADLHVASSFIMLALNDCLSGQIPLVEKQYRMQGLVSGKLHENWKNPRPFIEEFNSTLTEYSNSFSWTRFQNPELDRYHIEKVGYDTIARIDGCRDIAVRLPETDRDTIRPDGGCVTIGDIDVPLQVEQWSSYIVPGLTNQAGENVRYISLKIIVHPFSLRLTPQERLPTGLSHKQATAAVRHMRNAILKRENSNIEESIFLRDVVIV